MIKYRGLIKLQDGTARQALAVSREKVVAWAVAVLPSTPVGSVCEVLESTERVVAVVSHGPGGSIDFVDLGKEVAT